jgi:hypothetical protein
MKPCVQAATALVLEWWCTLNPDPVGFCITSGLLGKSLLCWIKPINEARIDSRGCVAALLNLGSGDYSQRGQSGAQSHCSIGLDVGLRPDFDRRLLVATQKTKVAAKLPTTGAYSAREIL